jgi:hypothetical protein
MADSEIGIEGGDLVKEIGHQRLADSLVHHNLLCFDSLSSEPSR